MVSKVAPVYSPYMLILRYDNLQTIIQSYFLPTDYNTETIGPLAHGFLMVQNNKSRVQMMMMMTTTMMLVEFQYFSRIKISPDGQVE